MRFNSLYFHYIISYTHSSIIYNLMFYLSLSKNNFLLMSYVIIVYSLAQYIFISSFLLQSRLTIQNNVHGKSKLCFFTAIYKKYIFNPLSPSDVYIRPGIWPVNYKNTTFSKNLSRIKICGTLFADHFDKENFSI